MYRAYSSAGSLLKHKTHKTTVDEKDEVLVIDDDWNVHDLARHIVYNTQYSLERHKTFTLLDFKRVIEQVKKWNEWMPRVTAYYAVKCNNNKTLLQLLAGLGINFDCASWTEMHQVLSIGVHPQRIILAHTAKTENFIKYAKVNNVDLVTFDSDIELLKIKEHHPTARLLIRIRSDAKNAVCQLGNKFGCCPVTEAPLLLMIAKDLGLNVVGVCFHVGSLCFECTAYINGIKAAKYLFEIGDNLGLQMKIVDIGGGFLCDKLVDEQIAKNMAEKINVALDEYFPPNGNTKIIAEPGRFFAASAFTLACLVHSAKRPISVIKGLQDELRNNLYTETNGPSSSNIQGANESASTSNSDSNSNPGSGDVGSAESEPSVPGSAKSEPSEPVKTTVIFDDNGYNSVQEFCSLAENHNPNTGVMYYLDNGIYGSFAGLLWKRLVIKPEPLDPIPGERVDCSLWGPTCDGKDMVCAKARLPPLPVPSWLIFPYFGAYTCTTSTVFNGYSKPLVYPFMQKSLKEFVQKLPLIVSKSNIMWREINEKAPPIKQMQYHCNLPFEDINEQLNKYTCKKMMEMCNPPITNTSRPLFSKFYFKNAPPVEKAHHPTQGLAEKIKSAFFNGSSFRFPARSLAPRKNTLEEKLNVTPNSSGSSNDGNISVPIDALNLLSNEENNVLPNPNQNANPNSEQSQSVSNSDTNNATNKTEISSLHENPGPSNSGGIAVVEDSAQTQNGSETDREHSVLNGDDSPSQNDNPQP